MFFVLYLSSDHDDQTDNEQSDEDEDEHNENPSTQKKVKWKDAELKWRSNVIHFSHSPVQPVQV